VDKAEDAGFRRGFSGKTNSEMFGKVEIGGRGRGPWNICSGQVFFCLW